MIWFLWQCFKVYREAIRTGQTGGLHYLGFVRFGVPRICLVMAHGRSAWMVSEFAIRYFGEQPPVRMKGCVK
jgi:hypothetical protein